LEPFLFSPVDTKRKVIAQVLICSGCCCGRTEKGRPPVPLDWLKSEWKHRKLLKSVQLTISGCLGPCDLANVVCITSPAGSTWLGNITAQEAYDALVNWVQASADAGVLLPLPETLTPHLFDPYETTALVPALGMGNLRGATL
jgi:predicted metal-binding protein